MNPCTLTRPVLISSLLSLLVLFLQETERRRELAMESTAADAACLASTRDSWLAHGLGLTSTRLGARSPRRLVACQLRRLGGPAWPLAARRARSRRLAASRRPARAWWHGGRGPRLRRARGSQRAARACGPQRLRARWPRRPGLARGPAAGGCVLGRPGARARLPCRRSTGQVYGLRLLSARTAAAVWPVLARGSGGAARLRPARGDRCATVRPAQARAGSGVVRPTACDARWPVVEPAVRRSHGHGVQGAGFA